MVKQVVLNRGGATIEVDYDQKIVMFTMPGEDKDKIYQFDFRINDLRELTLVLSKIFELQSSRNWDKYGMH
jgi:hypothetical protein